MRLVLIGAGGHASDILSILEALDFEHPVGLLADGPIDQSRFSGRRIEFWGGLERLPKVNATHYVLAVGYSKARQEIAARLRISNLTPLTLIHPRASIATGVQIGEGSTVLAGAIVSAKANVGDHVCLHHNSIIGHDCRIEDFCTVLPGASISGDAILEQGCLIGSGAVVLQKLRIGTSAIVGAGAVVTKDVPAGAVAVGNPARVRQA